MVIGRHTYHRLMYTHIVRLIESTHYVCSGYLYTAWLLAEAHAGELQPLEAHLVGDELELCLCQTICTIAVFFLCDDDLEGVDLVGDGVDECVHGDILLRLDWRNEKVIPVSIDPGRLATKPPLVISL